MRTLTFFILVLLAACREEAPLTDAGSKLEVWNANARDRLCIKGKRAGFIIYGKGDANCSARGTIQRDGNAIMLSPDGDPSCVFSAHITPGPPGKRQMPFGMEADRQRACAYYCGPGARAQATFTPSTLPAGKATDFAGDPLC
jgi:hypothetical protein